MKIARLVFHNFSKEIEFSTTKGMQLSLIAISTLILFFLWLLYIYVILSRDVVQGSRIPKILSVKFRVAKSVMVFQKVWSLSCAPSQGIRFTLAMAGQWWRLTARPSSSCQPRPRGPTTWRGTPGKSPGPSFTGTSFFFILLIHVEYV